MERLHLPDGEPPGASVRSILDLGANIGVSMAEMAERFPEAQIVGIELDGSNADLAEENLKPWCRRCQVIRGAAWPHPGVVHYVPVPGREYSNRVVTRAADGDGMVSARAYSMDELIDRVASHPGALVDYVKMDIEGSEHAILTENTGWAARVRAVQVEVHQPYELERCLLDLRQLGFQVRRHGVQGATVFGWRPVLASSAS